MIPLRVPLSGSRISIAYGFVGLHLRISPSWLLKSTKKIDQLAKEYKLGWLIAKRQIEQAREGIKNGSYSDGINVVKQAITFAEYQQADF